MKIFCRKIIINNSSPLQSMGPMLLAVNHPNSFLDAIVLDILFKQPVWSLARGDVFKKTIYAKLLTRLNILPVYRTTEGVENLQENYKTFEDCLEIFRKKGIVLIFSEGKCVNEWHLRPLKKGTARLAFSSWEKGIPLKVLPVGINYSSFRKFGKNVFINFGDILSQKDFNLNENDGNRYIAFNEALKSQLHRTVFEIDKADFEKQKRLLAQPVSLLKKVMLAIPAIAGAIIHAPLYLPVTNLVEKRFNNDHFDSIHIALLLFSYPVYLALIVLVSFLFTNSWWVLTLFLIIPFTAWSYVMLNGQIKSTSTTSIS